MKATLSLVLIIIFFGCSNHHRQTKTAIKENFNKFYKFFYNDSIFQMNRIVFPLNGQDESSYKNGNHLWRKDKWVIIKTYNDSTLVDSMVIRKKMTFQDSVVTEYLYVPNAGYSTTRKFQLKNGKWYLVFFKIISY